MRRLVLTGIYSILAACFAAAPGMAQSAGEMTRFVIISSKARTPTAIQPAAKPYQPVAVKPPAPAEDSDLESFRNEIAGVAKARIYVELERLVTVQGFFWDRDFRRSFDRQQPGVDNLAAAVRLERRKGIGWVTLANFAAERTAAPLTGRPGIVCAPGEPSYDDVEFDRMVDDTRSSAQDWSYPRTEGAAVRAAPRDGAEVIDTLGLVFVRVLDYLAKDKEPDSIRAAWARVATPAGKIGFVAPGALMPLLPERLCYGKDGFGRWRIAGFVGGN